MPKPKKIIMFGQVAMACFESGSDAEAFACGCQNNFYLGLYTGIKKSVLREFMPLSPEFMEYYAAALAPLWGGKTRKADSEDVAIAFKSHCMESCPFIVLWRPLLEDE